MATKLILSKFLMSIEQALAAHMEQIKVDGYIGLSRLHQAMRYSLLLEGKRLRPILTIETAALFDVSADQAMPAAISSEFIHAYSLVHDDLPAMDDSDMRRGQPSNHKAFDEATAILVGDALQTEAFALLSHSAYPPDIKCQLVKELAHASGLLGMAGGQMMDLLAERGEGADTDIAFMQSLKTGALIRFACRAGAYIGKASEAQLNAVTAYAEHIGLAFQIIDDVLDVTATASDLGKPTRQDAGKGKDTFVDLLGLEGAKQKSKDLVEAAINDLAVFGEKSSRLAAIAQFIQQRNM
ncbi:MAG: polyprenyl synthetase family protein [bacterium]